MRHPMLLLIGALLALAPASGQECLEGLPVAAEENAVSLHNMRFKIFPLKAENDPERGWLTYSVLTSSVLGTSCEPSSPGFASALAEWQGTHSLKPTGEVNYPTLVSLTMDWERRRSFVVQKVHHVYPVDAGVSSSERLVRVPEDLAFNRRNIKAQEAALDAFIRMRRAASEDGAIVEGEQLFKIFSGYRSSASDKKRCDTDHDCNGGGRAKQSNHMTGYALDIYVGALSLADHSSTRQSNRDVASQTPVYRWLVRNAARFGFSNYSYEPWHWELNHEP